MFILDWIDAIFDWNYLIMLSIWHRTKSFVYGAATVVGVCILLLWSSLFMYGSFYYAYMPAISHTNDINLQFSTCIGDITACKYPVANFTLKENNEEILMSGQPYVITIDLEVPESPVNQVIGNFMVVLKFYTRFGEVVHTASKATLIRYKSFLLQTLETFVYLPFYMFSTTEQKQSLSITAFEHHLEDPYKPTIGALVEVQYPKIEIYGAKLKIHAKFTGLRYILFYHPLLSAVIGIGMNLCLLGSITLLSWYNFCWRQAEEQKRKLAAKEERKKNIQTKLQQTKRKSSKGGSSTPPETVTAQGVQEEKSIYPAISSRDLLNEEPEETFVLLKGEGQAGKGQESSESLGETLRKRQVLSDTEAK